MLDLSTTSLYHRPGLLGKLRKLDDVSSCDLLLQQHRYVSVRGTRVSLLIVKTVSSKRDSNLQAQESDLNAAEALRDKRAYGEGM